MVEFTKEIKFRATEEDLKIFEKAKGKGSWRELFLFLIKQKKK